MSAWFQCTRVVLGLAAIVALLPAPLASSGGNGLQPPASTAAATETRHLTLTTSATPPTATAARQLVMLNVEVALKPKMHVYAPDQPKGQEYMPIVLTVAPGEVYQLLKPRYPPSDKFFFAPLKETQHVYSKPFRITQPIVLMDDLAAPLTVTGTVRYQACDDAICYVPQTVAVKWELRNR